MQPQGIDLSGLKDIHLPPVPHWWPIPWSGIAVVVGVPVFIVGMFFLVRYLKRITARRYAFKVMDSLEKSTQSPYEKASALMLLLKRLAVMKFKNENAAILYGDDWLAFLKRHSKTPLFQGAVGDIIKTVQYAPPEKVKQTAVRGLFADVRVWISQNI